MLSYLSECRVTVEAMIRRIGASGDHTLSSYWLGNITILRCAVCSKLKTYLPKSCDDSFEPGIQNGQCLHPIAYLRHISSFCLLQFEGWRLFMHMLTDIAWRGRTYMIGPVCHGSEARVKNQALSMHREMHSIQSSQSTAPGGPR